MYAFVAWAGKTLPLSACNANYAELNDWMTASNKL
jgi:hypothetical protein